jgi:hypothetical protein
LMKRGDESGAASTKLHRDKIARMSGEGKSCDGDHRSCRADAFVRPATLSEAKGSVLRHAD